MLITLVRLVGSRSDSSTSAALLDESGVKADKVSVNKKILGGGKIR